jgi:hypothetical protein
VRTGTSAGDARSVIVRSLSRPGSLVVGTTMRGEAVLRVTDLASGEDLSEAFEHVISKDIQIQQNAATGGRWVLITLPCIWGHCRAGYQHEPGTPAQLCMQVLALLPVSGLKSARNLLPACTGGRPLRG